jgi:hypothetical protein
MGDIRKIRMLSGAVLVLTVIGVWQASAIRTLRSDALQARKVEESLRKDVNTHAEALAAAVVERRRPEVTEAGNWLHTYYQSPEGFGRPQGLCAGGRPDFDAISRWLLDVYLRERFGGVSDEAARRKVVQDIRETEQWRSLHPAP